MRDEGRTRGRSHSMRELGMLDRDEVAARLQVRVADDLVRTSDDPPGESRGLAQAVEVLAVCAVRQVVSTPARARCNSAAR